MAKTRFKKYSLGKKRYLTLAYRFNPKVEYGYKSSSALWIGHAITNPSDTYNKEVGQIIAENRMTHEDVRHTICSIEFENINFIPAFLQEEIVDKIADVIKLNLPNIVKGL